jgi:hypothetical protein
MIGEFGWSDSSHFYNGLAERAKSPARRDAAIARTFWRLRLVGCVYSSSGLLRWS